MVTRLVALAGLLALAAFAYLWPPGGLLLLGVTLLGVALIRSENAKVAQRADQRRSQ